MANRLNSLRFLLSVACLMLFAAAARADEQNRDGALNVRALTASAKPQPGAVAQLFSMDNDWRYWKKLGDSRRFDSRGQVTFSSLPTDHGYMVRATDASGLVGYKQVSLMASSPQQAVDVVLDRPVKTRVRVQDEAGKPVAGARVWEANYTGANGALSIDAPAFEELDLPIVESNKNGELNLSALPPGRVTVRLVHNELAPVLLQDLNVGGGDAPPVVMHRGVKLKLKLEQASGMPVDVVNIDIRHQPFEHDSTLIGAMRLSGAGQPTVVVAPGKYGLVRVTHPAYAVTPLYTSLPGHTMADELERIEVKNDQEVVFHLMPKVRVHGRVVKKETGEPVPEQYVRGSLQTPRDAVPMNRFTDAWSFIDGAETDKNGRYELSLAGGKARVSFRGQGLLAEPDHFDIQIAAGGSTTVPDFVVRPMPKVRGVVLDEHGKPLPNAVVRFSSSRLAYDVLPVATDQQGRFELALLWIPEDFQTHRSLPQQRVLAYDPLRPFCAEVEVNLNEADTLADIRLQLQPQKKDLLANQFAHEFSPWERGVVPEDQREHLTSISLWDKAAPELDGAEWLNTDGQRKSLADFRGKYVLLQFWTTWCGPCHADMPMVKLLNELYGADRLVVIGVHDNSMPLAAIKQDVQKQQLTYPIVVDHNDGRIIREYKQHGIEGYPSYVLIGPDGRVVKDDSTIPGPTLRSFKIEIVRQLLMNGD